MLECPEWQGTGLVNQRESIVGSIPTSSLFFYFTRSAMYMLVVHAHDMHKKLRNVIATEIKYVIVGSRFDRDRGQVLFHIIVFKELE